MKFSAIIFLLVSPALLRAQSTISLVGNQGNGNSWSLSATATDGAPAGKVRYVVAGNGNTGDGAGNGALGFSPAGVPTGVIIPGAYVDLTAGSSYTAQVYLKAGGTYWNMAGTGGGVTQLSFTATAPVQTYKATVTIPANSTDRQIRYDVYQGTDLLRTLYQGPGDGPQLVQFPNLTRSDALTVKEVSSAFVLGTDGLWRAGTGETVRVVGSVTPGTSTTPPAVTATGPTQKTADGVAPSAPAQSATIGSETQSARTSVWSNQTPATGAAPLGDSVYKEGVEKMRLAIDDAAKAQATAESQSNATLSGLRTDTAAGFAGVNTRLDAANTSLASIKTNTDAMKTALETASGTPAERQAAQDSVAGMSSSAASRIDTSKSQAAGVFGTSLLSGYTISTPTLAPSGSGSQQVEVFDNAIPSATKKNWELNPFLSDLAPPWLRSFIEWFRAFTGWSAVVSLFVYALKEIRGAIGTVFLTQTQQTQSAVMATAIPVAGSAVGLTARVAIVAAIAAAMVAMPAAIIQTFSTDWSTLLSTFVSKAGTGGAGGGGGGGGIGQFVDVADQYVPVVTLIMTGTQYAVLQLILLPAQGLWQWTLRFLPL